MHLWDKSAYFKGVVEALRTDRLVKERSLIALNLSGVLGAVPLRSTGRNTLRMTSWVCRPKINKHWDGLE